MSCVVGVNDGGTIYMGSDSIYVDGWTMDNTSSPKLFKVGEFLMGSTGSIRVRQLMAHAFVPPPIPSEGSIEGYMVTGFIDAVRDTLKRGGVDVTKDDSETGGTFLVAVRGHLFRIQKNYAVTEQLCGYAAIGVAADIALGALCVGADFPPQMRVKQALLAAEKHNIGVSGPFVVETLHLETDTR
jgi:hypothetical protein